MEQISASDSCAGAPSRTKQVAWSVKSWCAALDISPAFAYELIAAGQIKTRKCGGKRLIETPPKDFLETLPDEALVTRLLREGTTKSGPGEAGI